MNKSLLLYQALHCFLLIGAYAVLREDWILWSALFFVPGYLVYFVMLGRRRSP